MDPQRLAAWPDIAACAALLEEARELADDTTRPVGERGDALAELAGATDDTILKRAYEARQKAVVSRRFRNWSELVSYAGFAVAPIGKSLGEASGLGPDQRQHLEAYCVAAHILDLTIRCREELGTHDRIYLPGDWMRTAKIEPEDLAAPRTGSGLRSVFNQLLDRIDPTMRVAYAAAGSIADPGLRNAAMIEIAERRRIARRLRRSDPLAGPVGLTTIDRAIVWLQIRLHRRGRA